jgi:hypothetical protein
LCSRNVIKCRRRNRFWLKGRRRNRLRRFLRARFAEFALELLFPSRLFGCFPYFLLKRNKYRRINVADEGTRHGLLKEQFLLENGRELLGTNKPQ